MLSWRDLWVIVQQSPAGSAVDRALHPDESAWGLSEHLLALIFDGVQAGNWQRGNGREQDRPRPFPRPGVESGSKVDRGKSMSIEDMELLLRRD